MSMSRMQMNVHEYATDESRSGSSLFSRVKYAYSSKRVVYGTVAFGVLILVVVLSFSLSGGNGEGSPSQGNPALENLTKVGPRLPIPEVTPTAQQDNKNALGTFLIEVYNDLNLEWNVLSDEDSPQFKALQWIAGRDEFTEYAGADRIQRYALATFYYATFYVAHDFLLQPTDWASQDGWLTDIDECMWEGIACNADGQVTGILLAEHALSGSLPVELGMLPRLQQLDLTTNFVYMEDDLHDVWTNLDKLRILLMEDNFIVSNDGLPAQFAGLVSLEKLQLSYNLLQGKLSGDVFTAMQSLQHLEFESNYLSGDIPSEVGQLPDLVYFYARRNLFTIQLSDMIVTDSYPSLFSLWLDNNGVTGRIPAAIGELTDLASFSITNSSLTGPIPTEFGLLAGLKRVWLYDNELTGPVPAELTNLIQLEVFEIQDNDLTGSVPQSICDAVASSAYEFRALTADCDQVLCDKCCTKCYGER